MNFCAYIIVYLDAVVRCIPISKFFLCERYHIVRSDSNSQLGLHIQFHLRETVPHTVTSPIDFYYQCQLPTYPTALPTHGCRNSYGLLVARLLLLCRDLFRSRSTRKQLVKVGEWRARARPTVRTGRRCAASTRICNWEGRRDDRTIWLRYYFIVL